MKNRMYLQLFEDGAGAGSAGGQGGNAGTGNGGQNGNYREKKRASQPNVYEIQKELEAERAKNAQYENEKILIKKGVKPEDLDYVAFKSAKLVDEKTDFAKAADRFLKENPRFIGGTGGTGGMYRVSTGAQSSGASGTGNPNDSINAAIRKAAGR